MEADGVRANAAWLAKQLYELQVARESVIDARRRARADNQSEAGEYLALEHLKAVEEDLLEKVLDRGLGELLAAIMQEFVSVAGAAA